MTFVRVFEMEKSVGFTTYDVRNEWYYSYKSNHHCYLIILYVPSQ